MANQINWEAVKKQTGLSNSELAEQVLQTAIVIIHNEMNENSALGDKFIMRAEIEDKQAEMTIRFIKK